MAVKKTEGGKWRVQVDVGRKADGSRDRRTKTVSTKREAQALEAEWIRRRDANDGRLRKCTVGEFVRGYWWPMKEASLEQTSLDSYAQDLRLRIMPRFANRDMASVTRADVQAMVSGCSSAATAKRSRDLLRAIYNEAIAAGTCESNPATGRVQMPRKVVHADAADGEIWLTTFAQHKPVLEAARLGGDPQLEKIIVLGLCLGLRKEEILGLNVCDVDFEAGVVHIGSAFVRTSKGNLEKPTKTSKSRRSVPLFAYPRARLMELLDGLPPDSPVVLSESGRMPPSTATKRVSRFVERNGLPKVTMRTLRHSFASACIDAGIDIGKVSKWLGHTNVTTTYNRYVKTRRKDLDDAASSIDAAFQSIGLS